MFRSLDLIPLNINMEMIEVMEFKEGDAPSSSLTQLVCYNCPGLLFSLYRIMGQKISLKR